MKLRSRVVLFAFAILAILGAAYAQQTTPVFSYQGRVKVQGEPFNGNGQFKFAIVSNDGHSTLWSHDGTSVDGAEPTSTTITLPVNDGVFNALIGDTTAGQEPINPTILADKDLKLRTWFSDGVHGFQQLMPDVMVIKLYQDVAETDETGFWIYVDGIDGDDANNGLTTETAKRTIQGAVKILPPRLNADVVVKIFPGTYREMVSLHGITTKVGKTLTFLGDTSWNLQSAGTPSVQISGANATDPNVVVRDYGLHTRFCDRVIVRGIHFLRGKNGTAAENSHVEFENCLFANNAGNGVLGLYNAAVSFRRCRAQANGSAGFNVNTRSNGWVEDCEAIANGSSGFMLQDNVLVSLKGRIIANNNTVNGIQGWVYTEVYLVDGLNGQINNNGGAAFDLAYMAHAQNYNATIGTSAFTKTGNGAGVTRLQFGGVIYW